MTKFLVDEDVNQKAVRLIPAAGKGFDIRYPEQDGHKGLKDKPVRDIAVLEDRVLVTGDRDFAKNQLKPGDIPRGVIWIRLSPRTSQKRGGELLSRFCKFAVDTFPTDPYNFEQKIVEVHQDGVDIYSQSGTESYSFPNS